MSLTGEAKRRSGLIHSSPRATPIEPGTRKPSARELWDFYLKDHGFIRAVYTNLHPIDGQMFRSSQPLPWQLRAWQKRHGIKSVINLRGDRAPGLGIEARACERLGLQLYTTRLYSRHPPSVDELRELKALFASVEYPALLHCKSGADRAGMASALYRMLHLGHAVEDASRELHWRFGHLRQSNSGILDLFLAQYASDNRSQPMDIIQWAETHYDPDELKRRFRTDGAQVLLADRILKRE